MPQLLAMNPHEAVLFVFIGLFVVFALYSVARSRRSERYQREAAARSKAIVEKAAADRERYDQVNQEQTRLLTALLEEIKGLRADLKDSGDRPV
jgi:hypothetical protein